jgi:hypothetical protein
MIALHETLTDHEGMQRARFWVGSRPAQPPRYRGVTGSPTSTSKQPILSRPGLVVLAGHAPSTRLVPVRGLALIRVLGAEVDGADDIAKVECRPRGAGEEADGAGAATHPRTAAGGLPRAGMHRVAATERQGSSLSSRRFNPVDTYAPGLLAIYAQEPNSSKPRPTKLIHRVTAAQLPTLVNPSSRRFNSMHRPGWR